MSRILMIAAALLCSSAASSQVDVPRVKQNYRELASGGKSLAQFTPYELEQLRQYLVAISNIADRKPETRAECMKRESTTALPSRLELSILDLKCSDRRP